MRPETTTRTERRLKRILADAARVYAATQEGGRMTDLHRGPARRILPWLDTLPMAIKLRTAKAAHRAGLHFATNGYVAMIRSRTVVVQAPWFLVSAVMASVGVGAEFDEIRSAGGTWPRLLRTVWSAHPA